MRKISKLIVHCTATPEGREVTVDEIDTWHRQRGFRCVGYHYVVHLDGRVSRGRDEMMPGAHCRGHNTESIGVCYVGGVDKNMRPKDTRTAPQRLALRELLADLQARYPGATIHGHCEFAAKACPCFDVKSEL